MLDPLQYYSWVLCDGMKTRFRMVMIAHPGPGIGFHKQFMWQIIILPTLGEPSHMRIHLTTDRDSTQLNASPRVGNAEYSPTRTSPGRQGQCVDSAHTIFIHLTS